MDPKFIYNNISPQLKRLLESQEKNIAKSIGPHVPPILFWHGEQLVGSAISYVLYGSVRGERFGIFKRKDIKQGLRKMIQTIGDSRNGKGSYNYRIVSLPSRKQSVVVIIDISPIRKDGTACQRTANCLWEYTWTAIGNGIVRRMARLGGLTSEDAAISAAIEDMSQHYRQIWEKETRSLCLHELRQVQPGRLATYQPVVMH